MLKDDNIDMGKFHLVHYGKKDPFFDELGLQTKFIRNFWTPFGGLKLYNEMTRANIVIVHSLAAPWLLLLIGFSKKIADKIYWVIWGKDLYIHKTLEKRFFYHEVYEYFRKKAFKNIHNVIAFSKEDYELAKQWYGVSGNMFECNSLYPYALDYTKTEMVQCKQDQYSILLGNSASKTNNHLEALTTLSKYIDKINKIYCPLSYNGTEKYKKDVVNLGTELFSDKFVAMLDFVSKDEYFDIISKIDIGFFNYNRQEGLANIYSLIMNGKTVYLRKNTTSYKFLKRKDIKVFSIDDMEGLCCLNIGEMVSNRDRLLPLIEVETSLRVWKTIFKEGC